jgi:hypothetical protein
MARSSAFTASIKELSDQLTELRQRRRTLTTDIAADPASAPKRTEELGKISAEIAAAGDQLAVLQDAQQEAAKLDRLDEFEAGKADTIAAKDAALAAARSRVEVAGQIDAVFDTLTELLTRWEQLTAEVQRHTREVCARTPPPGGRLPFHDRMGPVAGAVRHSGATTGLGHRIYHSGLGRRGIEIEMIFGAGFAGNYGQGLTVAAEAQKGVESLDRWLGNWIAAAGAPSPAIAELT